VTAAGPVTGAPAPRGLPVPSRLVLGLIHAYQGLRAGKPSPCRFWPTCSAYCAEAIEEHGLGRGGLLGVRRLLRCHPFGGRGIDLVPSTPLREENA
jgi:putative membrane protein insertion efficiency factor